MTTDEARAIVEAHETAERTRQNLVNLVRQPVAPNDPQRAEHERKVASAGDAYAAAQNHLDQLMVRHMGGVEVTGPQDFSPPPTTSGSGRSEVV